VTSASSLAWSTCCRPAGRVAGRPEGLTSAVAGACARDMPVTTPLADTATRAVAFTHGFAPPEPPTLPESPTPSAPLVASRTVSVSSAWVRPASPRPPGRVSGPAPGRWAGRPRSAARPAGERRGMRLSVIPSSMGGEFRQIVGRTRQITPRLTRDHRYRLLSGGAYRGKPGREGGRQTAFAANDPRSPRWPTDHLPTGPLNSGPYRPKPGSFARIAWTWGLPGSCAFAYRMPASVAVAAEALGIHSRNTSVTSACSPAAVVIGWAQTAG
jgi:hypothetical protein